MSEAAYRRQEIKRHWAEPGSRHDTVIRAVKFGLPILIVGLVFAVALMGLAANFIARYIERYRWIAYAGLAVILYVAAKMIYDGWIHPEVGVGRLFG